MGGGYSGHSDVSGRDYQVSDGAARALEAPLMGFFGAPGVSGSELVMGTLEDLDVEAVTNSITAELSSQMRSQANVNLTLVKGAALAPQVYIRVRWRWIVLPMMEVLLAATALFLNCDLNRGQPLLKSSLLALLASRLELGHDGAEDEAPSQGHNEETQRLDEVRSHLQVGPDGRLEFVQGK